MNNNLILNTDSYKVSHYLQYPPGTQYVTSYIEARGSDDPDLQEAVYFGLQAFIKEYLLHPFSLDEVYEAKDVLESHGEPFNLEDWLYIYHKYDGLLPLSIESIPEGSVVPLSVPMVQVRNTDPEVPWLTSYIETSLLRSIWYPTTVATISHAIKRELFKFAIESGSDLNGIDFKLHDFGARGVSSYESAMLGGMGHLLNFKGTDNVAALVGARRYYNEPMAGYSIPAAEHSTITSWGEDKEVEAYRNMLQQFGGENKLVSVVSDSYDIYNAVDNIWGDKLKDEVLNMGGTVVVRPDSGDPLTVPLDIIELLMDKYGYETNDKGYRTLPPQIRVIQGDGINKESIKQILVNMRKRKLTLDNIAFGMGGALLQQLNRDTLKFAMKANSINIDGKEYDVYKRPVTDSGKSSKAGIQNVIRDSHDKWQVGRRGSIIGSNQLTEVYRDGKLMLEESFEKIRKRVIKGY